MILFAFPVWYSIAEQLTECLNPYRYNWVTMQLQVNQLVHLQFFQPHFSLPAIHVNTKDHTQYLSVRKLLDTRWKWGSGIALYCNMNSITGSWLRIGWQILSIVFKVYDYPRRCGPSNIQFTITIMFTNIRVLLTELSTRECVEGLLPTRKAQL